MRKSSGSVFMVASELHIELTIGVHGWQVASSSFLIMTYVVCLILFANIRKINDMNKIILSFTILNWNYLYKIDQLLILVCNFIKIITN